MDTSLPRPLFVYGTLMDADIRALVLGRQPGLRDAECAGARAVFLPGRVYPGLLAAAGARAPGLLLDGLTSDEMAALDAYEGGEYTRRVIEVSSGGRSVQAQTYWPLAGLPGDSPHWSLADWQRNHKAAMLVEERRRLEAR